LVSNAFLASKSNSTNDMTTYTKKLDDFKAALDAHGLDEYPEVVESLLATVKRLFCPEPEPSFDEYRMDSAVYDPIKKKWVGHSDDEE
jgi:hypothetical protein